LTISLDSYYFFNTIVESGSLTAAATKLNLPKSKLSRKLAQLEKQLETQLLIRTTRRQQLTESGLLLYQSSQPHLEALVAMEALISSVNAQPKGKLNILLPLEFFNQVIGSLITEFAFQFPDLEINCQHYSSQYPEFDYQYDVVFVLHEAELPSSHWIGRTLLSFPQSIYAPIYSDITSLVEPDDLSDKVSVVANSGEQWRFRDDSLQLSIQTKAGMVLSSPQMRIEACQRGIGLVKLPDYIAQKNTQIKALVLTQPVVAQQLTLLYQSRNIPVKTRFFLDYFQNKIGCLL
jgi:DNA-binding transcriptional LysR family regulator